MENGWMMIYATPDQQAAAMLKGLLEQENIKVVLINKSGYPYTQLGEVEFYVFWQQAETALEIIYKATA